MILRRFSFVLPVFSLLLAGSFLPAQDDSRRGRKYKAPPETAHIEVTIVRDATGKPISNASVILRPMKDGHDEGNMELKTGPDGKASVDVVPTGSLVGLQVIANGFSTYGGEFEVSSTVKELTIRMMRPKSQISTYEENLKASSVGVQEPVRHSAVSAPKTLSAAQPIIALPAGAASVGNVSGHVTDEGGTAIANATVTVSDEKGHKVQTLKTARDGAYQGTALPFGSYVVTVSAARFATSKRDGVAVGTDSNVTVDVQLAEGFFSQAKPVRR